jgi:uncharacterized protein (DUF362 family)
MDQNFVSLVKKGNVDLYTQVCKALELVDFKADRRIKSVFIKVNLCYYWDSFTGQTTDPNLVAALIEVLRKSYGLSDADIKVVEADATAMKTRYSFKILKYDKLAEEKNIALLNLTEDKTTIKIVKINGKEISFKVPESLLNPDLFINMPKMKTTTATTITCALKNIFGCIAKPRKYSYHPMLDEAIVGINKILKPHLTLVDGLVALGSHPVKLGLVVAGLNTLAVDWVVSEIMGYSPSSIGHLRLGKKEGLGNISKINVVGEDLGKLREKFPHVSAFRLKYQNKMQLKLFSLYNRVVRDVTPPFLEA